MVVLAARCVSSTHAQTVLWMIRSLRMIQMLQEAGSLTQLWCGPNCLLHMYKCWVSTNWSDYMRTDIRSRYTEVRLRQLSYTWGNSNRDKHRKVTGLFVRSIPSDHQNWTGRWSSGRTPVQPEACAAPFAGWQTLGSHHMISETAQTAGLGMLCKNRIFLGEVRILCQEISTWYMWCICWWKW